MLGFSFSPEQEVFREGLRKFSLEELLPHYAEGDRGVYPRDRIIRVIERIGEADDEDFAFVSAGILARRILGREFSP
jgi:hypothetical protein